MEHSSADQLGMLGLLDDFLQYAGSLDGGNP